MQTANPHHDHQHAPGALGKLQITTPSQKPFGKTS